MKKKKIIIVLLILLCILLVGCKKKEEKETTKIVSDWLLDVEVQKPILEEDIQKMYDDAMINYTKETLVPVALLGEQVVAGKNYMFLSKSDKDNSYKVIIIYKDLQGNVQITHMKQFDIEQYVNKHNSLDSEILEGGWTTTIPGKPIMLEEKIQSHFDKTTERLMGADYYPISVIARNDKNATEYAILCYGRNTDEKETTGIFVLTLHVDSNDNANITGISAVDLKEFNQ